MVSLKRSGEFSIYKKGDYWLYCVKSIWWIGTELNSSRRKPCGFLRNKLVDYNGDTVAPWIIGEWLCWDKNESKWIKNNIKIDAMNTEYIIKKKMESLLSSYGSDLEKHIEVSRVLWNNLSKEERQGLVKQSIFSPIFKKGDLCSCCFSNSKTVGCIHIDCPGACVKCRGENEDVDCCACGKRQLLECPICQIEFPASFMNIFTCKHGVCWKCNTLAYKADRPLKKCPKCRRSI